MSQYNSFVSDLIKHLSLAADRLTLREIFGSKAVRAELIAEPTQAEFEYPFLRPTLDYWLGLPKIDGIADTERVDPTALVPVLGYLMLVDIETDGDYRYTLYGSKIARVAGFDMTGKLWSQIETTTDAKRFIWACYAAARKLGKPLYTVHQAPPEITVSQWHRLILPMGKGGIATRFLVCNVPIADDGSVR